jgi:hypothetical protein
MAHRASNRGALQVRGHHLGKTRCTQPILRADGGYSSVRDVTVTPAMLDDQQQTFFIAETLKYLYLTFTDDSVVPLDSWVFTTEAHPLPVF